MPVPIYSPLKWGLHKTHRETTYSKHHKNKKVQKNKQKTKNGTKHNTQQQNTKEKKVQTWCNKITLKPIITRIYIIDYFKCKILICKKKQKTKVAKMRSEYYEVKSTICP